MGGNEKQKKNLTCFRAQHKKTKKMQSVLSRQVFVNEQGQVSARFEKIELKTEAQIDSYLEQQLQIDQGNYLPEPQKSLAALTMEDLERDFSAPPPPVKKLANRRR